MGNFLLMTGVGVIFIFGLYLMKRFGVFIEKNEKEVRNGFYSTEGSLRIALGNPLMAESISGTLDKFSKLYESTEVQVFTGSCEAVLNRLSKGMADVAILPEDVDVSAYGGCNSVHVSMKQVLWPENGFPNDADRFASCLLGCAAQEEDGRDMAGSRWVYP